MRIPFLPVTVRQPVPSLHGSLVRYRPVLAIRLTGPADGQIRDGLIDSGADDTVFPESLAVGLGIDLAHAEERTLLLAARPQPIRCRFARAQLLITDGISETYEWTAVVGFVSVRLQYSLLGQAGFLRYFDCLLRGEPDYEAILTPELSFPGRRIP